MVMHARKPQRMNDGYFEKHQSHSYQSSKYNSKRDYERSERVSNYRDRDISPGPGIALNNGNSYRSQSPEIDSPSSRGHGGSSSHDIRDRSEHRGSDRYGYIQKMRDRDRDVYKKDKYSDKRDRRNDRESDSHRTNHDRDRRGGGGGGSGGGLSSSSGKYCSTNDKRSGSDERERDRDRDRDRDIRDLRDKRDHRGGSDERKRDRERDLRENERRRGGEDKRSSDRGERIARYGDWSEHVSSSGKMYYYNCKTEVSQWEKPKEWIERERNLARDQHREKDYREKDRDRERDDRFSRSSYSKHSSSRGNTRARWNYENDGRPPTRRRRMGGGRICENVDMDISPGDSTPTSEASFTLSGGAGGSGGTHGSGNNTSSNNQQHNDQSALPSSTVGLPNALPRLASHPNPSSHQANANNCSSASPAGSTAAVPPNMLPTTAAANSNSNNRKLDSVANQNQIPTSGSPNVDHHVNSNAPGPPKMSSKEQQNNQNRQQQNPSATDAAHNPLEATNHTIRENALNSPLYNLTHPHGMSPLNYTRSPLASTSGAAAAAAHANNSNSSYSCPKTVESNSSNSNAPSTSAAAAAAAAATGGSGGTASGSSSGNGSLPANSSSLTNLSTPAGNAGEGPPTPTQELDTSASSSVDQQQQQQQSRKEGTSSASLSNLQSCVSSSVQAARLQGPEISPKLAKYFRSDLIQHVTNWQADSLESQCQKLSEEAHLYGDLQCTKVSAELKCARSLVRITEITATLQEQRIMYLRQQIRRLDESKTQNSFMSEDS